ncbi:MAG: hypothetical protein FWD71_23515 [Oscillospiraceae bacterium]|nr:hypothetical protein [Oscillospiraceae bacterium]
MSNITAQSLKNTDIQTIDPSALPDIRTVDIDIRLPRGERIKDYIKQMGGNPYFGTYGKYIVKLSYANTDLTINDALEVDWKT